SHTVEIAWTPSHTGIKGNEKADHLAKKGAEQANETIWKRSRSNALRMNKTKTEIAWKKEWDKQSVNGRFAIANRFPPSLKPTERFKSLRRELFGRVTQCRTGHAF
ncbi:hypothetical protein EV361DRAFT_759425, partial [Lentinula raphanica]